jgi:hypothetical protein
MEQSKTPRDLLDHLDAAYASASPGPWQYDPSEGDTVWDADVDRPSIIALTRDPYGHCEADAALIVAAVNALPKLTAALRAVLDLADELDGLVDDETVDETARIAHAWTRDRLRKAITAALAPAEATR